jgi:hypothetical protein
MLFGEICLTCLSVGRICAVVVGDLDTEGLGGQKGFVSKHHFQCYCCGVGFYIDVDMFFHQLLPGSNASSAASNLKANKKAAAGSKQLWCDPRTVFMLGLKLNCWVHGGRHPLLLKRMKCSG